ncbi:MAG: DNA transfer protein p32 [Patescibacteria group bacterium]|nr:DNA transfer protein p32 [Patescibacteria group bacterium]
MVAAAVIGGAVVGGVASFAGSSKAAKTSQNIANQSNTLTKQMYDTTRSDLMPYQQFGQQGMANLNDRMGYLTTPFSMTQSQLEQTPGYQFNLYQGLKAVNNEMGARGLLNSGAVMKGAANYATGLADSTYMDQFNMDQTQKQNIYNRLLGVVQTGENAAAQTGAYGTQAAGTVAGTNATAAQQIGNAQMSAYNALGGIGSNIGNYYAANSLLRTMYGH